VGITEFDQDGNIVHEVTFNAINYRAWKHHWQPMRFTFPQDTLDLGELTTETVLTQDILLTNHADYEVTITGYHFRFGHFSLETEFPFTIPAGGSADITVVFQPDEAGYVEDALTLHSDNAAKTERIGRQIFLKAEAQQGFGISENPTFDIKVYPNPARNIVKVSLPAKASGTCSLTDISGRTIQNFDFTSAASFNLDISGVNPGMYLIQIKTTENNNSQTKLLLY
jgi:hypothetical protein